MTSSRNLLAKTYLLLILMPVFNSLGNVLLGKRMQGKEGQGVLDGAQVGSSRGSSSAFCVLPGGNLLCAAILRQAV
jgi:hypothetical protein